MTSLGNFEEISSSKLKKYQYFFYPKSDDLQKVGLLNTGPQSKLLRFTLKDFKGTNTYIFGN